jgi:hypothetical protein
LLKKSSLSLSGRQLEGEELTLTPTLSLDGRGRFLEKPFFS